MVGLLSIELIWVCKETVMASYERLFRHLHGLWEVENNKKLRSTGLVVRPRFEPGTSRIQVRTNTVLCTSYSCYIATTDHATKVYSVLPNCCKNLT
jgi:hypothetical protein